MTLTSTDESKDILKKYEDLWVKIRDLIRPITNNSDDYDEKNMTIKFNSDNDLPLKKTLEIMVMVLRSVFHKGITSYPKFSFDKCLNKL